MASRKFRFFEVAIVRAVLAVALIPPAITVGQANAGDGNIVDLQSIRPKDGFYTKANGTFLQVCSQTGCPVGPHMFAQTYIQASTRLDGTAQEIGLLVNFNDRTGYAPNWHPARRFTGYANAQHLSAGTIVADDNILFTARAACQTALSGPGPAHWQTPGYGAVEPTASNVPNGGCVFDYLGPATYQAYTGIGSSRAGHVAAVTNAGNVYTNSVADCMPVVAGSGPTGTGAGIRDGTCLWSFLGEGVNKGKSAVSLAAVASTGGGDFWGVSSTMGIMPGYGGQTWFGFETDFNNLNQDSVAGGPMLALGHFDGGGSAYTYPLFAYYFLGSGAVNSKDNRGNASRNPYGAHYGFWIEGQPGDRGSVTKDAAFADADNAAVAFQVVAGRAHVAGFKDDSNSLAAVKISGRHTSGLDLSEGAYAAPIKLPRIRLADLAKVPCALETHGAVAYVNDDTARNVGWHKVVEDKGTTSYSGLVSCDGKHWLYE